MDNYRAIQTEINDRIGAIDIIINSINGDLLKNKPEDNIFKGLFFVLLYGVLEYTITSTVSATIHNINTSSVKIDLLKPCLLSIALDPKFEAIKNSNNQKWKKRHELLIELELNKNFYSCDTLLPCPTGNIKFENIDFIWKVFGITSKSTNDQTVIGLLKTLAENRMAIAHGRKTPQDIGRNYSKQDITKFYSSIKKYCEYILTSFEQYFSNKDYLK